MHAVITERYILGNPQPGHYSDSPIGTEHIAHVHLIDIARSPLDSAKTSDSRHFASSTND